MVSIQNQVAVVTGAGRGIGRAIAIELGKLGSRVALAARSRTELEDTARTIGSRASVIPTDVRKKEDLQRLFEQVSRALGPIDILVNAAGLGIFGPVADFKDEDFENLIETNLSNQPFKKKKTFQENLSGTIYIFIYYQFTILSLKNLLTT